MLRDYVELFARGVIDEELLGGGGGRVGRMCRRGTWCCRMVYSSWMI